MSDLGIEFEDESSATLQRAARIPTAVYKPKMIQWLNARGLSDGAARTALVAISVFFFALSALLLAIHFLF